MSLRSLRHLVATLTVALVAVSFGPTPLPAQQAPAQHTVDVRVETGYRWLHEDAHPGSVPFEGQNDAYKITRHVFPGWDQHLEIEKGVIRLDMVWDRRQPPSQVTVLEPRDATPSLSLSPSVALQLSGYLQEQRPALHLPETIVWEMLVPAPPELAPGDRWTDTLDFHAVPMDSVQEHFGGVWRYEVEGDTVLFGRSLPRVRFEADVEIRRIRALEDLARSSNLQLEREATGRMAGWFVLDTLTGTRIEGMDSTRLSGTATLRGTDRSDWTSDVVYEQERRWIADTPEQQAALEAEWERGYGGMLVDVEPPPESPANPALVDSLWTGLVDSLDPSRRQELRMELLEITGAPWEAVQEEEAARLLASGDPSGALGPLLGRADGLRLDSAGWAFYQPYLDDPELLWRLGLTPRDAWPALSRALLWSAPWSGRPESEWACGPEDCGAILEQMEASPNPMLRETALVGRFATDPSTEYEALEAAWEAGATHLQEAVRYAQGVGAQWPAAPKTPMPGNGAGWRDWLRWMGGEVRFERSHRRALAVYEARTGRDPLADPLVQWDAVKGDSARLVVGSLLRSAERLGPPTQEELIQDLLGESEALHHAATRELPRLGESLVPVSDAEAIEFLAPLLDSILSFGTSPWESAPGAASGRELGQGFHGLDDGRRFLLYAPADEGMVGPLADAAGIESRSEGEWEAMDRRSAAVGLVLERPARRGDIVRLNWSWYAWADRADDAVPRGYGGGGTLWLVATDEGWVAVARRAWIT